jgi:hypothetical protein
VLEQKGVTSSDRQDLSVCRRYLPSWDASTYTAIYDVQYLGQAISPIPLSMRKGGEGRVMKYYIIYPMSPWLEKITSQQQCVHDMWFGKRKRSKSWMIS